MAYEQLELALGGMHPPIKRAPDTGKCLYAWTPRISGDRKSVFECKNCSHETSGPPKSRQCPRSADG